MRTAAPSRYRVDEEKDMHLPKKNVEPSLLPVPRCKGLRIARIVETSNAESPTLMLIIIPSLLFRSEERKETPGLYINIARGVPVALFLTIRMKLRSSYIVKTKASVTPFPICASCPTRAQAASGMRHDKANVRPFFFSGPIKRHKIRGRNAILTFAHNLIRHHPEQKQARI